MDIDKYNKVFHSPAFERMERVVPEGRRVGLRLDGRSVTWFEGCTWPEAFQKALKALETSQGIRRPEAEPSGLPAPPGHQAHEVTA